MSRHSQEFELHRLEQDPDQDPYQEPDHSIPEFIDLTEALLPIDHRRDDAQACFTDRSSDALLLDSPSNPVTSRVKRIKTLRMVETMLPGIDRDSHDLAQTAAQRPNATTEIGWRNSKSRNRGSKFSASSKKVGDFIDKNPLSTFVQNLQEAERPKEACSNSRSSILHHFALFHLPSILITLFLFSMHLGEFKWTPPHPTNDELSVLQFAAKIHEAFILASITDVLLHRIHFGLLQGDGIALGFLSSPFQISAPVRYFMSWEFWAALLHPTGNRRFHSITSGTIMLISILGLVASPFSAITMVPRLGWWKIATRNTSYVPNEHGSFDAIYFIGDPYETRLDSTNALNLETCNLKSNSSTECSLILEKQLKAIVDLYERPPRAPFQVNTTFSVYRTALDSPISISKTINSTTTFSTCPMDSITLNLGLRDGYDSALLETGTRVEAKQESSDGKQKLKQPLVVVQCSSHLLSENSAVMQYDFDDGFFGNISLNLPFKEPLEFANDITNKNKSLVHQVYLDIETESTVPISAAILSLAEPALLNYPNAPFGPPGFSSVLCLVHARWIEARVWRESQLTRDLLIDLGFPIKETMEHLQKSSDGDFITITEEWLRSVVIADAKPADSYLNQVYKKAYEKSNEEANEEAVTGRDYTAGRLETLISLTLIDALSAMLVSKLYSATQETDMIISFRDPAPQEEDTRIYFTYWKHMYAYSLDGSISLSLAFAGLLLHVVLALVHLAIIMSSRHPWHSSSWTSIGELLILALQSRAPKGLENVSVGVSSSQTWSKAVLVRDADEDKRLQMVVSEYAADGERCDGSSDAMIGSVNTGTKYN